MIVKTTNGNLLEMVIRYNQAHFYLFDCKENPLIMIGGSGNITTIQVHDAKVFIQFFDETIGDIPHKVETAEGTSWTDSGKMQKCKAIVTFTYKGETETAVFDFVQ